MATCPRDTPHRRNSPFGPGGVIHSPGGRPGATRTPKAAALHVARTVCRRAERRVVRLAHDIELPTLVVIYLNRLSDLLFMLARVANKRAGAGEVTW